MFGVLEFAHHETDFRVNSSPLPPSLPELQGCHEVLNMRIRLHCFSHGKGCCPSGLNLNILSLCNEVKIEGFHILWDLISWILLSY